MRLKLLMRAGIFLLVQNSTKIINAVKNWMPVHERKLIYGDGQAAEKIIHIFRERDQRT